MAEDACSFPDRRDPRRRGKPLDRASLEDLALGYVARFATSAARLNAYLRRKLAERGWQGDGASEGDDSAAGEGALAAEALVARFVAAGYVDDAAFARARSAGLLRRGYGGRRIEQALRGAGIAPDARLAAQAGVREERAAALRLAEKRRFGPFGARAAGDRATREKQVAAMLRAGHSLDSARALIDAGSVAEARRWADEEES